MVTKTSAPYGTWKSPITLDSVVSKSVGLSCPRVAPHSGRAFYRETTETGRKAIVEITENGLKNVLPDEYSAVNTVYEYGGSAFDVLPDDRIIFSNKGDTLHILNPDTQEVSDLVDKPNLRYSNFDANQHSHWVVAIEEDHEHDTPREVRNYVVGINTETNEVKRILDTADFYYPPSFSPDGTKLVWLEWNHPELPFDAAKLYWAKWHPDGSVSDIRLIAGENKEGVVEPRWGPDGSLYFGMEVKEYRGLFRILPGENAPKQIDLPALEEAEFGDLRWFPGSHTYAPLSERYLVASARKFGVSKVIAIDLESNSWYELADRKVLSDVLLDAMIRLDDSSVLIIGGGTESLQALYRLNIKQPDKSEKLRSSSDEHIDATVFSEPKAICIPSQGSPSRRIHGFLWLPHSPTYTGVDGTLPPLIIMSHGGPTSYTPPGLKLWTQYFTSRGYAYLALNYTGSVGYGKRYREALFGHWGEIEIDDAAEFANHLVSTGQVKADGVGITGVSAGGYDTLQALVRHPRTFAAGVCLSGISNIQRLAESTHKLESDYMDPLVLPKGTEEDKEQIYRQRSPVYNVDKIESPLLLLHGTKDMITPIDQAEAMVDAIKKKGGDVKIIIAEGEGHGFSQPKNVRMWLEEEEKWWQKTLL